MLTTASSLISGGQTTCTNPLGCIISSGLNSVAQLVNTILASLQTATVDVQRATGLDGVATQGLIHDVIGLDVAQANLDLLYAGCPVAPRLAQ